VFTARYGLNVNMLVPHLKINQRREWSRALEVLSVAHLLTAVHNEGLTFPSRGPGVALSTYKLQAVATDSWSVCLPFHPPSSPASSLSLYLSGPGGDYCCCLVFLWGMERIKWECPPPLCKSLCGVMAFYLWECQIFTLGEQLLMSIYAACLLTVDCWSHRGPITVYVTRCFSRDDALSAACKHTSLLGCMFRQHVPVPRVQGAQTRGRYRCGFPQYLRFSVGIVPDTFPPTPRTVHHSPLAVGTLTHGQCGSNDVPLRVLMCNSQTLRRFKGLRRVWQVDNELLFSLFHRACCWVTQLLHQPLHIHNIYKMYTLKH